MIKFLLLALVGSVIATSTADLVEDPSDANPLSSSKRRHSRKKKRHRSRKYYSSYVNTIVTNVTTEGNLCTAPSKSLPIKNGQYFNIKNKNGHNHHHMIKIKLGTTFASVSTGKWFGFINSGQEGSCPTDSLVLGINGLSAATTLGVTTGSTIKLRFKSKKSKKKRRGRHHSEGADVDEIEITTEELDVTLDEIVDIVDIDDEDWHLHDQEEDDDVDSVFSDPNDPLDSSKSRRNRKRKSRSRKKKRKGHSRKRKYKSTYKIVSITNVTSRGDLCTDATTLPISAGQYFYIMNGNGHHHHHMIKIKLGSMFSTVSNGQWVGFFNNPKTEAQCPLGVLVIGIDNGNAASALNKVTGNTLKLRFKNKKSKWGRHHSEGEEIEIEDETEEETKEETEEEIDIDDENWKIYDAAEEEDVDRRMR